MDIDDYDQLDAESTRSWTYFSSRKRDRSGSSYAQPPSKRHCLTAVAVVAPDVVFPASLHANSETRKNSIREGGAIRDLLQQRRAANSSFKTPALGKEHITVILDDFTIYRGNNGSHPNVMRPLSDLLTRSGDSAYRFDGIVRIGDVKHRVYSVPFNILSLDGYGSDAVTISNRIWIQSPLAQQYNVWYHLKRPADEYARYHVPFQWLADFSKHFVAYLDVREREDLKDVRLHDFRSDFYTWLQERHGSDKKFQSWHGIYDFKEDFRTVITANFEFLWKESVTVQEENRECFLWKEVDAKALSAVPLQPWEVNSTIVTPYVYNCFRKMYFASAMECRAPIPEVQRASITRSKAFASRAKVSDVLLGDDDRPYTAAIPGEVIRIRPGDVVQIEKDEGGPWGGPAEWYAYVQSVEARGNALRVIWLYWPEQTTCANMTYPHRRELFFSDHCNCGDPPISTVEVLRTVQVKFNQDQNSDNFFDFFVRQTYKTADRNPSWVTFNRAHFKCSCRAKEQEIQYSYGQTVLVTEVTKGLLEPVIVLEKSTGGYYKALRLKRRKRDYHDAHAQDNELVYSEDLIWIRSQDIKRACHIRRYSHEDVVHHRIPAPYSYNGTGDCWVLTAISEAGTLRSISTDIDMIEGFDPKSTPERISLKGCSLFCGGGSFDRGFEESGAVQFTHSVDWAQPAIHTYRANAEDPDKLNLFYGNVNDWLARLLKGDPSAVIPQVGSIGFMTAGSPCVAFSMLQPNKMSESSLRNASLVAALATAIDVLRPEYGVFENVFAMGNMCGNDKKENVLSQMICCFVGMGYQVQIVNQDARSAGSGEQRSRLLICIAAPGLAPMSRPPITHAHPEGTKRRVIGKAPNGESFGERTMDLTPFELNTAQDVIGDLPDIGDGKVNICIPFPDHRVSANARYENWLKIKHIPRFPHGCSWTSAVQMGYMPKPIIDNIQRKSKLWNSAVNKAYGRLYPDKSMPTVITVVSPDCAMNGRALHYDQPRVMTVMEARRAQSYPDHEVLIGLPSDQWRSVGNSVDRKVSVAAGVSLRQAWLANDDYQAFIDQFQLGGFHTVVNKDSPVEREGISIAVSRDIEAAAPLDSVEYTNSTHAASTNPVKVIIAPTTLLEEAPAELATSRRIIVSTEPVVPRKAVVPLPPAALPPPNATSVKPVVSRKSTTATRPNAPARSDDDSDLIVVKRISTTKRPFSGAQTSQKTVQRSSRFSLPAFRSIPTQSNRLHTQKPAKQAPRQSLPAKLIAQTRDSRQSSDELGESLSTPIIPAVHASHSNLFAKYRARERSPTTGAFLPRSALHPHVSTSATQRPLTISTQYLPFVKSTNGMVSPLTTSEERSPIVEEPSLSFADIAQMPPANEDEKENEDEDELSIHVDNALAVTSTAGLGVPDVRLEDCAVVSGSRQNITVSQGEDLMEWELTG